MVLVALHFAARSKSIGEPGDIDADVVTFGSPRLGNAAFKAQFEDNISCIRTVLDRDIVTRVPFWGGYEHVGKPVQIRDGEVLDRDTSNWEATKWLARRVMVNHEMGVNDHSMQRYCSYIENLLGSTE